MKAIFTFLLVLLAGIVSAQINESFTDGNFTENPAWTGDSDLFEVNAAGQLHTVAAEADTAWLSVPCSFSGAAEWRFWIKLSFNTSANNHARIYLGADQADLEQPLNGYYLRAGGADDSVVIYRQDGSEDVAVFRCQYLFTGHSVNALRFRILRDTSGIWTVFADSSGGENYVNAGSFPEDTYPESDYFVVWCKFTSSNGAKFYVDDILAGEVITDTLSPRVSGLTVRSRDSLQVRFTEPVDATTAGDPMRYTVAGTLVHPASACRVSSDPAAVLLVFRDPLEDPPCDSLRVEGISDAAGNLLSDTTVFFCRYDAKPYDILIHEILADPDPVAGLPGSEFIELFNRSNHPVSLKGWSLQTGASANVFPDFVLPAGSFLILSKDSAYRQYGETLGLLTAVYSVPNEGACLVLRDSLGRVIHGVDFQKEWIAPEFKQEGGWSVEMADPANPCGCEGNWQASSDVSGGTPGRVNSVAGSHPDTLRPWLLRAAVTGPDRVEIRFSDAMDSLSLAVSGPWRINGAPAAAEAAGLTAPRYRSMTLFWEEGFASGTIYEVRPPSGITDCTGNPLDTGRMLTVMKPSFPEPGEVVLNEILPEPGQDGSRFAELLNLSCEAFDLRDLAIAVCMPDEDPESVPVIPLASEPFQLLPLEYAAACESSQEIEYRYSPRYPARLITVEGFPSLPDGPVSLILSRSADGQVLDRVDYSLEMHHPLLSSTEGVSLERVNPYGPSCDPSNWHSAASSAGFATPGDQNSQWWVPGEEGTEILLIEPVIFSPDNDGRDDVLHILCAPGAPGFLATVQLFDSRGRFVAGIAASDLIGAEGRFSWDGLTPDRRKAPAGIYIVCAELVKPDGTVIRVKRTAVLAVRR